MSKISFNRPAIVGKELYYMSQVVSGGHAAGDGVFTRRCHALLQEILGARSVLLTTSCTHALEMSALLLDIRPGDEVVVPAFTFVSTVNAFVLRGARPVFGDIRADTLNIDETLLEGLLTPRTKAIVPVHYAGVGCEMDAILDIAGRHGIPVVEDNAHGLFGRYRGRNLGTFGCMATQSFHETKNVSCGEGGALVINDERYRERAEIIREKGTNRSRFLRGEVDKYTWVDVGSSYLPSELLAAFLYAQLEARAEIQEKRRAIWKRYDEGLRAWARASGVRQPHVPEHCEQAYHMYYLVLPSEEQRNRMLANLVAKQIHAVFHYTPLHLSPMARALGLDERDCPVTEAVSGRLLRLPFFNDLTPDIQDRVIDAVRAELV